MWCPFIFDIVALKIERGECLYECLNIVDLYESYGHGLQCAVLVGRVPIEFGTGVQCKGKYIVISCV